MKNESVSRRIPDLSSLHPSGQHAFYCSSTDHRYGHRETAAKARQEPNFIHPSICW